MTVTVKTEDLLVTVKIKDRDFINVVITVRVKDLLAIVKIKDLLVTVKTEDLVITVKIKDVTVTARLSATLCLVLIIIYTHTKTLQRDMRASA